MPYLIGLVLGVILGVVGGVVHIALFAKIVVSLGGGGEAGAMAGGLVAVIWQIVNLTSWQILRVRAGNPVSIRGQFWAACFALILIVPFVSIGRAAAVNEETTTFFLCVSLLAWVVTGVTHGILHAWIGRR